MTDGEIKVVTPDTLLGEAMKIHDQGWRLVQICARALKDGAGNEITAPEATVTFTEGLLLVVQVRL